MLKKLFRKRDYNFDFMKIRKIGFSIAIMLVLASITSFCVRGLNFGIDFQGGILVEVSTQKSVDISKLRQDLNGLKDLSIQSAGLEGNIFLIQAQPDKGQTGANVVDHIKSVLGADFNYDRVEVIGPTIGEELKKNSLLASILVLLAIAVYIWFRFEWPFAIGCLVSLAFTLVVVLGLFSSFYWEFDMVVVAGVLSLAGYACNDTIVTYDRVRENLKKHRAKSTDAILNQGINETLSRTILTGISTLVMIFVLLVMGGTTLRGFSLSLFFGILFGTFASIFVAVPLLRYFDIKVLGDESAGAYKPKE
ncbi:MAG: protein translocase subunit SecF [Alphaproteobacteria bacterium]|nr:protein translocase subunit SecF [Alphaproteobacteria bacterium]